MRVFKFIRDLCHIRIDNLHPLSHIMHLYQACGEILLMEKVLVNDELYILVEK